VLAERGYPVTLVDLSNGNLALANQKAAEAGVELEAFVHANALDLTAFPKASFDAALLMGPLYHLHQLEERRTALQQASRLLKLGGLIFAAFITRFAAFRDAAINSLLTLQMTRPIPKNCWQPASTIMARALPTPTSPAPTRSSRSARVPGSPPCG